MSDKWQKKQIEYHYFEILKFYQKRRLEKWQTTKMKDKAEAAAPVVDNFCDLY